MDTNSLLEHVRPELFILIIFAWCLGLFLKKAPWFKDDWSIPFILLVVSITITTLYLGVVIGEGFNAVVYITGVIQGVIIASVAVFANEAVKQTLYKRDIDKRLHSHNQAPPINTQEQLDRNDITK